MGMEVILSEGQSWIVERAIYSFHSIGNDDGDDEEARSHWNGLISRIKMTEEWRTDSILLKD